MIVVDRLGNIQTNGESQNNFLKKLYGTFLGRCALKILVCRFVSNLGGWYMNSRFSKWQIESFIEKNNIDMSQFENRQFTSYNDFFTRKILPGKRPYSKDDNVLISPADAKLSCYRIDDKCRVTIKDTSYSLEELLEDKELANEYLNGYWLVFRLTVDDYHRYHYIDDGKIIGNKFINGKFHTVNPIANDYYPIYKQNTRSYTVIESKNFGKMIQMEVGAMMVGRIVNYPKKQCYRGEEKGYFEFGGSTVVILLKENQAIIDEDIVKNTINDKETVVKLGESIGKK
ncbi:MAG TPA: phosphatidylserine decarboxylase [Candidatus Erysipelatoclostridium merdavium]|uniref:Phosphatidylserine decarboxylase n=1 Tax=Candidatus Erysipelatoclostridium merdavium TaxID=2838566 RepID=A0A9D1XKS7_9FIRM|nr:phosphatidylserine decarboxylase [Candidatus Erysipelatoclostridium merdavium]